MELMPRKKIFEMHCKRFFRHGTMSPRRDFAAFTLLGVDMSKDIENAEVKALRERLAAIEAENAALKAASASRISLRVSDKGAISLYGIGQFPVTLYLEQWEKVLGQKENILAFAAANKAKLATPEMKAAAKEAAAKRKAEQKMLKQVDASI